MVGRFCVAVGRFYVAVGRFLDGSCGECESNDPRRKPRQECRITQKLSKQIGDLRSKSGILRPKYTPKTVFGAFAIVTYVDSASRKVSVSTQLAVRRDRLYGDADEDVVTGVGTDRDAEPACDEKYGEE